ncbi:MAG TPA: hypothetical protein PKD64_08250 [Pirellulaceae bacterium]|nr:hypothetical protein [Pirellulaceae bacterium]HMO92178.1 hypothetical protein [Pirellulaceae bacterium]HMP68895.1 hypothetical protein [Pirellulaceae bacterium]
MLKNLSWWLFYVAFIVFVNEINIVSANDSANELSLSTQQVIVFKDGYSLIVKRATGKSNHLGQVYTDDVPDAAVLGSFWAIPEEGRIVSTLAGWVNHEAADEKETNCKNQLEILLANKGNKVKVELNNGNVLNGTIHEVLTQEHQVAFSEPGLSRSLQSLPSTTSRAPTTSAPPRNESVTISDFQGAQFILRENDIDTLLNVAEIRTLSMKDMKAKLTKTVNSRRTFKRLTFTTDSPNQEVSLSILYFRPGVRWIPTYRIALNQTDGKKMADISLQAELLNEAEDLQDVAIDLVVGVPNFRFKSVVSPLVLESVLRDALSEAAPSLMGQMASNRISNSMFSQRASEYPNVDHLNQISNDETLMSIPNELTAVGQQDLFVYKLPKSTIRKGERIAFNIFSMQTPYRDIYTWDITVNRNDIEMSRSAVGTTSPLTLSRNDVWHQIEFSNQSKVPFTTGAALITQGNQPLAQELLTYTSIGNICRIPVTVAIDMRGKFEEQEIARDLNALNWDGNNYAKIEKEGKVVLRNNKSSEVDIEVLLKLGGRATEASHNGVIQLTAFDPALWTQYRGNTAINNSSQITWKTNLKPGEVFEPKSIHHYFTRH